MVKEKKNMCTWSAMCDCKGKVKAKHCAKTIKRFSGVLKC